MSYWKKKIYIQSTDNICLQDYCHHYHHIHFIVLFSLVQKKKVIKNFFQLYSSDLFHELFCEFHSINLIYPLLTASKQPQRQLQSFVFVSLHKPSTALVILGFVSPFMLHQDLCVLFYCSPQKLRGCSEVSSMNVC